MHPDDTATFAAAADLPEHPAMTMYAKVAPRLDEHSSSPLSLGPAAIETAASCSRNGWLDKEVHPPLAQRHLREIGVAASR